MQMFGVGVMELIVVLLLAVLVVGPDRLPGLAADLARWIRQGRAYARHLLGDFNEVMAELKTESGVTEEDWKEIDSVVRHQAGDIGKELQLASKDAEDSGDLEFAKGDEPAAPAAKNGSNGNGAKASSASRRSTSRRASSRQAAAQEDAPGELDESTGSTDEGGELAEEKPWYVPEKASRPRRRRSE